MECFDDLACLIKLADSTDDGSGCGRTVTVPCGGELEFYYGPNGQEELSIYRRRNLMTGEALEAEATNEEEEDVVASSSSLGVGGDVVGAAFSSLGEVAQVTSSSLRGGAKGSKTGA